MLFKVDVTNYAGDVLSMYLDDISDGLVLQDIDGLDPVKATLVSSKYAQQDGSQYHSATLENRNIIFTLGLEPDWATETVRTLRHRLYNYFMPKSTVQLTFYDDSYSTPFVISGRVESCEAPLFSKEPEVDISIMCFDPDFVAENDTTYNASTVSTTTEFSISYGGTANTGLLLTLNVNRTLSDFTIYHRAPDGIITSLDFSASMISGDVVKINTNTGSKGATLTRSSVTTSVLYGVPAQSTWIELKPGVNYFRVYATGAAIPFSLKYTNRFGGL